MRNLIGVLGVTVDVLATHRSNNVHLIPHKSRSLHHGLLHHTRKAIEDRKWRIYGWLRVGKMHGESRRSVRTSV